MTKKNIVLFDMDGTLTPARESAGIPIAMALAELSRYADVGIVTGSNYEYLQQQCGTILNSVMGPDLSTMLLFPCNGGQFYKWNAAHWELVSDKNMLNHLGEKKFNELIKACIFVLHAALDEDLSLPSWDMGGHFVEYRGPMVNLCFPGRQANKAQRAVFQRIDGERDIRNTGIQRLQTKLKMERIEGLELKLGGNTSIDIFPTGWDKTLALEHLNHQHIWFVGDRCTGDGNDREIYEYAALSRRGFQTESPAQTISIIENIIDIIRGKQNK